MRRRSPGPPAGTASSVGYAAIPSADGTISACRDAQGRLKVIDAEAGATCATGQQAMKWNQQGPQGPVGPQRPRGITGLQALQDRPARKARLTVPAFSTTAEKAWFDCRLHANESVRDSSVEILDDWYDQTVTLMGIHSASSPFEAGVRCRDQGNDAYWNNVRITAIPVTQLHNSPSDEDHHGGRLRRGQRRD